MIDSENSATTESDVVGSTAKNRLKTIVDYLLIALGVFVLVSIVIINGYDLAIDESIYDEIIAAEVKNYDNVDFAIIKSIIKRESKFRPQSRGAAGEVGLMQLMPSAIKDWETYNRRSISKDERFKPENNIKIGTWFFSRACRRWQSKNDECYGYALADYNAGQGNMKKWVKESKSLKLNDIVKFPGTRNYVSDILEYYEEYKLQLIELTDRSNHGI